MHNVTWEEVFTLHYFLELFTRLCQQRHDRSSTQLSHSQSMTHGNVETRKQTKTDPFTSMNS